MNLRGLSLALAMTLPLAGGCALTPAVPRPDTRAGYRFFDGRTGAHLTRAEALGRLAGARHVYVGEEHAARAFHAAQLEVLRALAAEGRALIIGVEWLQPSAEPALNAWLAGDAPVTALPKALDWAHRWGHDFNAVAPIFRWARAHRVRIAPLNAERGLARAVARHGLEGVSEEVRRQLPPLDTGNAAHRAWFEAALRQVAEGHGHEGGLSEALADRFYLAQLVWDETMSRRVAQLLEAHPQHTVVVFAGVGHVDYGHGVPLRARALTGEAFRIVRPSRPGGVAALGPFPGAGADFPEARADLIWVAARPRGRR